MKELEGLSVVIPVYREDSKVVMDTYTSLTALGAEVTIVDDGDTVLLPVGTKEVSYTPNQGYGYALKKGIHASSNDIIMTCDGDGQHRVEDAVSLYRAFKLIKNCDMLVGSRHHLKENFLRKFGRKSLNFIGTLIARHYLVDLNSGMRIFKKELALKYEPILCDTFSFTTSLTISMITDDLRVFWFPIEVQPRAHGHSHVKVVRHGLITLFYILYTGIALRTRNLRSWLRIHIPLMSLLMSNLIGGVARKILQALKKDSR